MTLTLSVTLLECLHGVRSLSLIGLGKNVGKTTALNALVEEATRAGVRLGLTSIGRDGELLDAISSFPKPPIGIPRGTLVATAACEGPPPPRGGGGGPERVLALGPPEGGHGWGGGHEEHAGAFEILERTGERTALGPVVLARALRDVQWELSGPATGRGLLHIRESLFRLGAELVILDGAFDRRSSATPSLTQAAILVSGAALDPDRVKVLEHTRHMLNLFRLPAAQLTPAETAVLERRSLARVDPEGVRSLEPLSILGDPTQVAAATRGGSRLLVGRSLTSSLLEALAPEGLEVVVRDATHALVSAEALRRFSVRGGKVAVGREIRLPFVVCNPYSPYGWRFDADSFLQEMAAVANPLPVVDLVLGRRIDAA